MTELLSWTEICWLYGIWTSWWKSRFLMTGLLRRMHVFVTQGIFHTIHPHGIFLINPVDPRVPQACAYTYQSYPTSVKEGMPTLFPHGLSELNGGLQIFKPSKQKYDRLLHVLNTSEPTEFLFADQSVLSKTFHGQWIPLYAAFPRCWYRPYIYNALKTLRTAHAQIWNDDAVKNVHFILGKPWDDKSKTNSSEETHSWWWKADTERQIKERELGLKEPNWG